MVARLNRNAPLPEVGRLRVDDSLTQRALDAIYTSLREVLRFLQPFVQAEKWQGLEYLSGWADYIDPTLEHGQSRKNPLGRVELRGLVTRASGVTTDIALLPTGHRPAKRKLIPVTGNAGAGFVSITSGGVIEYAGGGTTYLSLEGVTFDTEA